MARLQGGLPTDYPHGDIEAAEQTPVTMAYVVAAHGSWAAEIDLLRGWIDARRARRDYFLVTIPYREGAYLGLLGTLFETRHGVYEVMSGRRCGAQFEVTVRHASLRRLERVFGG